MRIVVLHAGGLGDLVLVESYLAALREQYADARLELVCRADVAPAAALYARPPDAVHTFDFNPYRWAIPDERAALEARTLLHRLPTEPVDLFASAELRATWLSEVLAAALAPVDAVIADPREPRASDVLILLGRLKLDRTRGIRRLAPLSAEHELDRYARLAGAPARRNPALRPIAAAAPATELVVFPLGATRINRWPMSAMGETALRIAAARGATVTLIGGDKDRAEIESAVAAGCFGAEPAIVTGAAEGLAAVAARIAGAVGYVGIETGLAHLAAAYGVPGATVYGGGYWPLYAPWAPRTAGVVAPIPCFGCEWDCAFERAFCIEGVDVQGVVAAFEAAYADGSERPVVSERDAYDPRERAIFEAAAKVHRAAQRDRAARLTAITRLRDLLARYARRTRRRSRNADVLLASLLDRTTQTARRLEQAAAAERAGAREVSGAGPPEPKRQRRPARQ
jgi:ADP-heptose:LPS heptosyltransferase